MTQPLNQPQEIYINQPLPNGQRRCTWKKFDACDYITMGAALGFAITCAYIPDDTKDGENAYVNSVIFSLFCAAVVVGKKAGEFCEPFSCRDKCMSQLYPERYGIPNYTLQENRN